MSFLRKGIPEVDELKFNRGGPITNRSLNESLILGNCFGGSG